MIAHDLYRLLQLPQEVIDRLDACAQPDLSWMTADLKAQYLTRSTSDEGLQTILTHIGEDPDGMRILWVLLEMARDTWAQYEARQISQDVFVATFGFVPRFLHRHKALHGSYVFTWAWWFWRQLSMVEYRIGCLEYELVEEADGCREVSLHIPGDADLCPASVDASFRDFRAFLAVHHPDWLDVPWVCDSWMMSPALEQLLPDTSNVLAFNRRFELLHINEGYEGALDWVFPPHREVSDALPENTSLQRSMKAWLLSGKKIGWCKAALRK